MQIAYFDCISGVSGDMLLGALVAAGVDFEQLQEQLRTLHLDEFELATESVSRQGLAATKVHVHVHPPGHGHADHEHAEREHSDHGHGEGRHAARRLGDVLHIIEHSEISDRAKADASAVFHRLAEAEAKVHGTTPDQVHFHEVGAVDSIVDIVGAAVGLEMLAADQVLASSIRTGTGYVQAAHGRMAVPVPATVELLRDFPTVGTDVPFELTTPTGAAVLTTLAQHAATRPAMLGYRVGYGAGGRDNPQMANVLRLFVGQVGGATGRDEAWMLETNLDDVSPEIVAYAMEQAFAAGALDVFTSPIHMKKGRPGVLLQALVSDDKREAVEAVVFSETSTLGVRRYRVERSKLEREHVSVATPFGQLRVKVGRQGGAVVTVSPEHDDCKAAARAAGVPLKRVYQAALAAAAEVVS